MGYVAMGMSLLLFSIMYLIINMVVVVAVCGYLLSVIDEADIGGSSYLTYSVVTIFVSVYMFAYLLSWVIVVISIFV